MTLANGTSAKNDKKSPPILPAKIEFVGENGRNVIVVMFLQSFFKGISKLLQKEVHHSIPLTQNNGTFWYLGTPKR